MHKILGKWEKVEYRSIFLFLFIAFILPLVSSLLQAIIQNNGIKFILYGMQAASPSIAAVMVLAKDREISSFLHAKWKKEKLITAFILPVVIVFLTMLAAKVVTCFLLKDQFALNRISMTQMIIILWAFVAEELGWRGYLQSFLYQKIKRTYWVPCVVGVIWAVWHYHYFLFGKMQVPLLCFFLGCVAESYIYSYLLILTKDNLISAMMYHLAWNLLIHVFAINPVDNMGSALPYIILTVLEIVSGCFVFWKMGKEQLKEKVGIERKH